MLQFFGKRELPARLRDLKKMALFADLSRREIRVVDGFMHGLHRSRRVGLSLDFAEHRSYQPGDDIRRIDWRVYGRTDRDYVKEYEADTNAAVTFALSWQLLNAGSSPPFQTLASPVKPAKTASASGSNDHIAKTRSQPLASACATVSPSTASPSTLNQTCRISTASCLVVSSNTA